MSQVGEREDQEKQIQDQVETLPVSSKAWLAEIDAALKREKNWREDAKRAIDRYANKMIDSDTRIGNFNILWSNTELLRNAIYNQAPKPDVRQRWEQKDPLSLAIAQVLDRSLEYIIDVGNFDATANRAVLDYLLPGRAVIRVRYDPEIIQQAGPDGVYYDTVASENVVFETVAYKDFVCHDAPDWTRCEWVAFRHYMTKAEAQETFPEYAEDLAYFGEIDEQDEEHKAVEEHNSDEHTDIDAKALVWEIWDRRSKSVIWVSRGIPVALLRQEPPLELSNFFPIARPMIGVMTPDSLMPTTIFSQYEKQADELDLLTDRIHKTAGIVKWRGFYDSSLGAEMENLFASADDGDLVPTSASTLIMERGGFSNMIWTFPIEEAVKVLTTLYDSREKVKDTIYEITGISDVLRGVSNQYETASAQKIKAAWGGSRVDGYKREVQRFLAETLRIAAEIVAEHYSTDTLASVTGLMFPTAEEKEQMMADRQAIDQKRQQLQQVGAQQQATPEAAQNVQTAMQQAMAQLDQEAKDLDQQLEVPSWDEISETLKSDLLRSYKVQIETDSTIAPTQEQHLNEIQTTMQAIGVFGQQFYPAVQNGVCPPQLFSQILYAVVKRTPLANDLSPFFEEYMEQIGVDNPLRRELENTKKELEAAKNERELKEKELDIKAREIKQKGLIEARKLDIEAQEAATEPELEKQRMQTEIQKQALASIAAKKQEMEQNEPQQYV